MRLILPTIFIIISGILFFFVATPSIKDIKESKSRVDDYSVALSSSKNLEEIRDSLLTKYNSVSSKDKERLTKFLPNTVNNIKFILEVEQMANLHNMPIKNIKFDPKDVSEIDEASTGSKTTKTSIPVDKTSILPYGVFPIEFTTEGDYNSFSLFLKDLEKNLRLVDVKSISFKVPDQNSVSFNKTGSVVDPNIYEFTLKVETYWLK